MRRIENDKKLENVICRSALKQDVVQVNCPNECVVKMHRDCNNNWRRKNTHGSLECVYCHAKIARTNRGVIPISTKNVTEAGPQTLRRSSRVHVPFNARRDILFTTLPIAPSNFVCIHNLKKSRFLVFV